MYYHLQDCVDALGSATEIINERTKGCESYTRGHNDCAALLIEYDKALRGGTSKADLPFTWGNQKEFLVKLRRLGFTVEEYLKNCGYDVMTNKRPQVGDVAFARGAMIAGPKGWVSTTETNEGVAVMRQLMYLEVRMSVIARPRRNTNGL